MSDETAALWQTAALPAANAKPAAPGAKTTAVLAAGSERLPANIELSLWQFIGSVRAQQQARPFELLESHLKIVELASSDVAPVPLPGAAWFLVMGLLGMAGVRVTGRRSPGPASPQPA